MQSSDMNETVGRVVCDVASALGDARYHPSVLIVGLSEIIGRVIAAQPVGTGDKKALANFAYEHIEMAIRAREEYIGATLQ